MNAQIVDQTADLQRGYCIGPWKILPREGTLSGPNGEVHLEPKVVAVLTYLACNAGEVVPRTTLIDEIWQGSVVTDDVLTRCICALRSHLQDDKAHPTYIKTIPKRGYSLIAAVEPLSRQRLTVEPQSPGTSRAGHPARKNIVMLLTLATLSLLIVNQLPGDITQSSTQTILAKPASKSIAVLPFINLSDERDDQYFSLGLAEDLLTGFTRIQGLQVAARTSSFAYAGSKEDIRSIGQKLNVTTVLEGSVRIQDQRIRITAQLVNVKDGFNLWSQTFDREMDGVFSIQDEITRSIAETLGLDFTESVKPRTANIQAYDFYLLGRHLWHQRTQASLTKAAEFFTQAIEHDPEFALAYSGLADANLLLSSYTNFESQPGLVEIEKTIFKALALNPGLGEAYASLGLLRQFQGDFINAEIAHRRALELNPDNAMAYMWLGNTLSRLGKRFESGDALKKAYQLEPLHPTINQNLITWLIGMDLIQSARTHMDIWLSDTQPNTTQNRLLLSLLTSEGRFDKAMQVAKIMVEAAPTSSYSLGLLAVTYARLSDADMADKLMQQAEALPARSYELASMRWEIQLILGRYEELATILKQDLLTQHLSNHDRGGIHTTLGIAQFHLNQFSGAARNLTAARKITNKNRGIAGDLDLIHYLAYCYQQLEKPEKESQLLDEADTIIGQVKGEYSNSLKLQVALQHTFRNEISEALALINDVSRDNPVITNLIVTDKRYSAISRSIVSQQALTL